MFCSVSFMEENQPQSSESSSSRAGGFDGAVIGLALRLTQPFTGTAHCISPALHRNKSTAFCG